MDTNIADQLIFVDQDTDFTLSLLEDQLNYLGDENESFKSLSADGASSSTAFLRGRFKYGIYISAISNLCRTLNQQSQVKYHAVELFDLFMTKHIHDVLQQTKQCYGNKWPQKLSIVLKRVTSQIILRMLSCIQIASKIRNQESEVVQVGGLLYAIRKAQLTFGKDSLYASEIRVLRTVGYNVNQKSLLDYMETILEVLTRNDQYINTSILYKMSLRILDLACVEIHKLYKKLYVRVTGNRRPATKEEHQRWKLIERDNIFLIVAVISCGAYILNPCSYVRIVNGLNVIVNIPLDEIMDFTVILIDFVLER